MYTWIAITRMNNSNTLPVINKPLLIILLVIIIWVYKKIRYRGNESGNNLSRRRILDHLAPLIISLRNKYEMVLQKV
jgi:hypothetical protein